MGLHLHDHGGVADVHHEHVEHGKGAADSRRRLAIAIGINVVIVVVEAAGGFITGSLALLADAGHNLTDVGALVIAYLATVMATRAPTSTKSFGYYRLEILAALANGAILVLVSIFVFVEALSRFADPQGVPGPQVLFIALMALGANVASAAVLLPRRESLNVRAAVLHLAADALSSVGVIVAALFVMSGQPVADAVAALFIGVVIVVSGYGIVRESVDVLLQGVPRHVDVDELRRTLVELPDVEAVHDVHVWSLTSGVHVASLHVVVPEDCLPRCDAVIRHVAGHLKEHYGIEHTTVQVEPPTLEEPGHVHD